MLILLKIDGVQTCIVIDISPCGTSHKRDILIEKLHNALESTIATASKIEFVSREQSGALIGN
uniref:Uncharacterized protein n=1 Tax=Timema monikensis TaxID=170555 RepID=A0A7R9HMI7_9NEOP|nr:unnamed protein product [Timema monikensis]